MLSGGSSKLHAGHLKLYRRSGVLLWICLGWSHLGALASRKKLCRAASARVVTSFDASYHFVVPLARNATLKFDFELPHDGAATLPRHGNRVSECLENHGSLISSWGRNQGRAEAQNRSPCRRKWRQFCRHFWWQFCRHFSAELKRSLKKPKKRRQFCRQKWRQNCRQKMIRGDQKKVAKLSPKLKPGGAAWGQQLLPPK